MSAATCGVVGEGDGVVGALVATRRSIDDAVCSGGIVVVAAAASRRSCRRRTLSLKSCSLGWLLEGDLDLDMVTAGAAAGSGYCINHCYCMLVNVVTAAGAVAACPSADGADAVVLTPTGTVS